MAAQNLHAVQRLFLTREKRLNLFWRIFLFLIGFFILDVVSEALGSVIADRLGWQSEYSQFLSAFFSVPLILGYTWLFRLRIDKRSQKGLALTPLRRAPLWVMLGLVLGCALLGILFLIEDALGWVQVVGTEVDASGLATALLLVFAGLVFAGATGFIEELGFRGYIFQNLGSRFPLWLATLVTGVVFGLLHFGEIRSGAVIFLLQAVLITTLFVLCRLRSGALWLAIGVHAGWNWMEDSIFGFASTDTHALLHLTFSQPMATVFPEFSWVGALVELLGIGVLVWWPRRSSWRLSWQARLDEESGSPARESPALAQ